MSELGGWAEHRLPLLDAKLLPGALLVPPYQGVRSRAEAPRYNRNGLGCSDAAGEGMGARKLGYKRGSATFKQQEAVATTPNLALNHFAGLISSWE